MITMDDKELRGLERKLKRMASRSIPFAVRNTINGAAFEARRNAIQNVRDGLILRNTWTTRTIGVEKAKSLNMSHMEALTGSSMPYMETQEFGGVVSKGGTEGVRIPTSYSAGQGKNSQPRTRVPRKPNKISNIKLQRARRAGKSRAQKNFLAVQQAAHSNRKFVFLELKRSKGIFKIVGGKRKPRVMMVHDLTRPSVTVPAHPWLRPATVEATKKMPGLYLESLRFQMRRLER